MAYIRSIGLIRYACEVLGPITGVIVGAYTGPSAGKPMSNMCSAASFYSIYSLGSCDKYDHAARQEVAAIP